ncbi:MAG TPA: hypothetical protein VKJ01_27020 [Candidatus Solibacter sp.]|nr:hypothetical protein [Candidatus Solibacter sp.]
MKHIATVALMLNLGVAGVYADQKPGTMTFSGTSAASTINLNVPNTTTGEDNLAGSGTLGSFTFRNIFASMPQPSSTCSGPFLLHLSRVAGAGVFRFQDGSLLKVNLTQGGDCIDLQHGVANCTSTFLITGGTGRFQNASGMLILTEAVRPVLADFSGNPVFFASTGAFTGTVLGVSGEEGQDERH